MIERHRNYQKGLMWTLAYHPRVPKKIRAEVSRWGPCKDEFERDDGWQQQLYGLSDPARLGNVSGIWRRISFASPSVRMGESPSTATASRIDFVPSPCAAFNTA